MVGGAALAISFNDRPAVDAPRLDPQRVDGGGNATVPGAAGGAVGNYLRQLNGSRVRAERINRPDQPRLGIDDMMGFMIDEDYQGTIGFNIRFNLDRRSSPDWTRYWTDISVSPETEQSFDYRAIARAAYTPEVRYWLYGARWASFDTVLPRLDVAVAGGAVQAVAGAGPYTAVGRNSYAAGNQSIAPPPRENRGPVKAKTLREFLLSVGSKIIRQPIVYVILLVCLGMVILNSRRQPHT